LNLDQFTRAWNLTPQESAGLWLDHEVTTIKSAAALWGLTPSNWQRVLDEVTEGIAKWHGDNPETLGPSEQQLGRILAVPAMAGIVHAAANHQAAGGLIKRRGTLLHMPGHRPSASAADEKLWAAVEPLLLAGGLRPPRVRELAETLDLKLRLLEKFLTRAEHLGWVHRVAANRYFPPAAVLELAESAERLCAGADGRLSVAAFRDLTGIGRNVTIDLLEFFDKVGFSRRDGEHRQILASARQVFTDETDGDA